MSEAVDRMLERVAEALRAEFRGLDGRGVQDIAEATGGYDLTPFMLLASAAIAAMRSPTDAMFKAGFPYMDSESSNMTWWRVLIDEALK